MNDDVKLMLGDCLNRMSEIPDGSVDAIVTSPPYNIGKQYGEFGDDKADYLEWLDMFFAQARRVSRCLWINLGYRKLECGNVPIAFQVWNRVGMFLVQSIRWEYGAGMTYKSRFNHRSEDWLWFVGDPDNYTFNPDSIRDPSLSRGVFDKRNNPDGKLPSDVWYYPHVPGNAAERCDHPAQYPVPMIQRIILACTNPGETILDPFMGSGSTGVASLRTWRRFIGIERDPTYFEIARKRIADEDRPMFDGPEVVQERPAPTLFDLTG